MIPHEGPVVQLFSLGFFLGEIIFHHNTNHTSDTTALFLRLCLKPLFKFVGHSNCNLCLSFCHRRTPFDHLLYNKIRHF